MTKKDNLHLPLLAGQIDGTQNMTNKLVELHGEDKVVIALAKLSEDGQTIDYDVMTWNFPINDLNATGDQFFRMIRAEFQNRQRLLMASADEKQKIEDDEELKGMLE